MSTNDFVEMDSELNNAGPPVLVAFDEEHNLGAEYMLVAQEIIVANQEVANDTYQPQEENKILLADDAEPAEEVVENVLPAAEVIQEDIEEAYVPIEFIWNNFRGWECEYCPELFTDANVYSHHLEGHEAERKLDRPYLCYVCHKAFGRISSLVMHVRMHTHQKQFSCGVCKKSFYQKGNLIHHMYTHTGERPYLCGTCPMRFNQMSNVRVHKARHHPEEPKMKKNSARVALGDLSVNKPKRAYNRRAATNKPSTSARKPRVIVLDMNDIS